MCLNLLGRVRQSNGVMRKAMKDVLVVLADWAGSNGKAYGCVETIRVYCQFKSDRTVQAALAALEADDWIRRDFRTGRCTVYWLNVPRIMGIPNFRPVRPDLENPFMNEIVTNSTPAKIAGVDNVIVTQPTPAGNAPPPATAAGDPAGNAPDSLSIPFSKTLSVEEMFTKWFDLYPNQVNPTAAMIAFGWVINAHNLDFDDLMGRTQRFVDSRVPRRLGGWVPEAPYPANWLRQMLWKDYPPQPSEADAIVAARAAQYLRTGKWLDVWGERPKHLVDRKEPVA